MSEFIFGVDLDGVCADYNEAFRLAHHKLPVGTRIIGRESLR